MNRIVFVARKKREREEERDVAGEKILVCFS